MQRSTASEGSIRKSHVSILILLMALVLASCQPPGMGPSTGGGSQGTCNLAWNPNGETDLAGYRLYYGTASGDYDLSVDVGKTLNCSIRGLTPEQTYYFAVTAYNIAGVESSYSTEISLSSM